MVKQALYSYKSNKVIEIDKCLIAVDQINKSDVFSKSWNNEDRVSISVSSENEFSVKPIR